MREHNHSRRDFLRILPALTLSAMWWPSCSGDEAAPTEPPEDSVRPARVGVANPYVTSDGRPLLVSVEGTDFEGMLAAGLNRLGGLSLLVGAIPSVLIKPNCNAVDIYPGISSADSVAALVSAARAATAGTVLVGDQGYHRSSEVYPHMGLEEAVTSTGGSLITFLPAEAYAVREEAWDAELPDVWVYREVYNSPVIIGLASLKRHHAAVMTCALKNNVGSIWGPRASGSRSYLHSLNGADFQRWVAEIAGLSRPELTIVDARSVLCKDGPFTDSGEVTTANRVVLCGDMVATDAYCAQLLASHDDTFSVEMIQPALERAEQLGLGTSDLGQVEIIEISA